MKEFTKENNSKIKKDIAGCHVHAQALGGTVQANCEAILELEKNKTNREKMLRREKKKKKRQQRSWEHEPQNCSEKRAVATINRVVVTLPSPKCMSC